MLIRKRTWILGKDQVHEVFGTSDEDRILVFDTEHMEKLKDEWLDPERLTREAEAVDLLCAMRVGWLSLEECEDFLNYSDDWGTRVVICDAPEYHQVLAGTTIFDEPGKETMTFVGR